MKTICENFPITNSEYENLEIQFGKLTKFATWRLLKKNSRNNHTDEFDDVNQELLLAAILAGSYYKRQIFIEKCMVVAKTNIKDNFIVLILQELQDLWHNRRRHGANKQKFGGWQECILEKIVRSMVPLGERPDKNAPLEIDTKFATYCKAIAWNKSKSMGRKITREKSLRSGMASLSEFQHLAEATL